MYFGIGVGVELAFQLDDGTEIGIAVPVEADPEITVKVVAPVPVPITTEPVEREEPAAADSETTLDVERLEAMPVSVPAPTTESVDSETALDVERLEAIPVSVLAPTTEVIEREEPAVEGSEISLNDVATTAVGATTEVAGAVADVSELVLVETAPTHPISINDNAHESKEESNVERVNYRLHDHSPGKCWKNSPMRLQNQPDTWKRAGTLRSQQQDRKL